uniref:Uncharacterized protein n=1 Tax=Setaria viridis TaxID=4556 RepID=A0A4U6V1X4_SETVI|nr:hypothetical protein SEVIR_4G200202v2 [Setaria viridis]
MYHPALSLRLLFDTEAGLMPKGASWHVLQALLPSPAGWLGPRCHPFGPWPSGPEHIVSLIGLPSNFFPLILQYSFFLRYEIEDVLKILWTCPRQLQSSQNNSFTVEGSISICPAGLLITKYRHSEYDGQGSLVHLGDIVSMPFTRTARNLVVPSAAASSLQIHSTSSSDLDVRVGVKFWGVVCDSAYMLQGVQAPEWA